MSSNKTFAAQYASDATTGTITVTKDDEPDKSIAFTPSNTKEITFYLNNERPFAELLVAGSDKSFSFVIITADTNEQLGQEGVIDFRMGLDNLASKAGFEVKEYIDPNDIQICPDGVENMDELQAIYDAEMSATESAPADEASPSNAEPIMDDSNDTEEGAPSSAEVPMPAVPEPPATPIDLEAVAAEAERSKAQASEAIARAVDGLEGVRQELEEERQRRLDEIKRIQETEEFDPVPVEELSTSTLEELLENTVAEIDAAQGSLENAEDTADLLKQKEYLSSVSNDIEAQLDDYDNILQTSREEQDDFIEKLDKMDNPSDTIIADLIAMLNEQTAHNDQLNAAMKRERTRRQHYVEQLEKANHKISEQSKNLDDVKRRLKLSQENQRKSEKFVRDARNAVTKVIAAADKKVDEAIQKVEAMRRQVEAAKADSLAKEKAALAMGEERDLAINARNEAIASLDKEKARTAQIVAQFDEQLDAFADETVAKIRQQIERADAAEHRYADATARISEVESELAEVRNTLMTTESKLQKREVDLEEANKKLNEKTADYDDLESRLKSIIEDNAELEMRIRDLENDVAKVSEERDTLASSVRGAYEDRDNAIAERLKAVKDAYQDRDASVATLESSTREALAANEQVMSAMAQAMALPSAFGSRKTKLDAIEAAWNAFVSAQGQAQAAANTVTTAMTDTIVPPVEVDLDEFIDDEE